MHPLLYLQAELTPATRTLADHIWPRTIGHPVLRDVGLVLVGVLGFTLCAQIQIPFWPVPMTLQTFGLMLLGTIYGARLSAWTLGTYLLLGALGVPVFAGSAEGTEAMIGPSGGFLVGFFFGATLLGWLVERGWDRTPARLVAALALGTAIPLVTGALWLSLQPEAVTRRSWGLVKAVRVGVLPYLPGALLKLIMAAALLLAGQQIARHLGLAAGTAEDPRLLE